MVCRYGNVYGAWQKTSWKRTEVFAMPESMTVVEAGRRGGRARAAAISAEQRRASSRRAYLDKAVRRIAESWSELDEASRARLAALLQPPEPGDAA
jgi:kynureninase